MRPHPEHRFHSEPRYSDKLLADIAFNPAGILYGWSENSDDLVTINTSTGAATIVANAAISTFGSGMDFGANGVLYLAGGGGNGAFR